VFAFHSRITDNLMRLPAFDGQFGSEFTLPVSAIACFRGACNRLLWATPVEGKRIC